MGCAACGGENPQGARFCNNCGAALSAVCAGCGHTNPPRSRFCNACGQGLTTPAPAPARVSEPTAALVVAAPESYTPPHLAEKILAGRDTLQGERKQVTVLFADVVGSTELIQGRDAEEAQSLLDGTVQVMMGAVHRYEGTVSRLTGDGLMALFGAPIAHEDHALRACYAALAMQEAARRHAEQVRRAQGVALSIRVGLSAGEVVVRTIRDDLHMDFTAMGQTVHLAARMEQLARPDTTALTPDTLALVEGYVQVRSVGLLPIKGLPAPLEVFELLGTGQARTRLQAAARRGLTRFVGRDEEIGALYGALGRAGDGRGQVAALVGEPGVGKSRLVWELTHSHRVQGWTVLESGSVSYGKATTYLPVIDLLKRYCRIEPRDDERAIREKVTGKLLTLDRALEPCLPALLALLDALPPALTLQPRETPLTPQPPLPQAEEEEQDVGGGASSTSWEALDPAERRRQTLDAVKRLLLRESQEQPLLLVFEDLHWIDSETQALLDGLVESLPSARVLLLVNYRPEYTHGWGSKTYYRQVRVDPLPAESADELLVSLLGDDASVEPLKWRLARQTEGNPFFLEESVRTLIETGVLVGERGAHRLPTPLSSIQVPATVQAVLAARIDRLPAEQKALLQTAAAIGKDVPDVLLRVVSDLGEEELRRGLAALQAAEFMYEARLFPELEHTFKHTLTHEVAYGSLLHERRRTLHARVVDAIERVYADRLDEHVELLAHHALRAEMRTKAFHYCRRVGNKALRRSANREAVAHFELALSSLEHLPESRETLEQAIDLRFDLRQALIPLREFGPALEQLHRAAATAEALGDRRRLGRTLAPMASSLFVLGEHDRAIKAGERALAIGRSLDDVPLQVEAEIHLVYSYRQQGNYRRPIDGLRWVVASLDGELARERFGLSSFPVVLSRALLAWCLADLGEFAEGMVYGEEAVRIAETLDHPYSLGVAQIYLGFLFLRQGRLHHAISLLEQCLELSKRSDLPQNALMAAAWLGSAFAHDGRPSDGVPLLEQAVELLGLSGILVSYYVGSLSEAYLLAGQPADARRLAVHALDSSRQRSERGHEAYALHILGEIAARGDRHGAHEAEARYRESLALAEELEMRPLQAHCHLGLGKLYRLTGRTDEARTELQTAIRMLGEMGMVFWLPEAQAELDALR